MPRSRGRGDAQELGLDEHFDLGMFGIREQAEIG